jgi:hypothetical protein
MTAPTLPQLLEQYAAAPPADPWAATSPADVFNQLAVDLPPLYWQVYATGGVGPQEIRGQIEPGTDDTDAAAILTAWAARLALTLDTDASVPGMREYSDLRDGCLLVVWGVVDHERWTDEVRRAHDGRWSA